MHARLRTRRRPQWRSLGGIGRWRSQNRANRHSFTHSTEWPASRSGRSRSGRWRRATFPASGTLRLSPFPRNRRSITRESPSTARSTSHRSCGRRPSESARNLSWDRCAFPFHLRTKTMYAWAGLQF